MLHIVNGDVVGEKLKQGVVQGDVAWRWDDLGGGLVHQGRSDGSR
jgi:hypothetical protein